MKKEYKTPRIEKLEFNYTDVVVASGTCNGNETNSYNNDPNGQYYKCTCGTYYAPGWGQNC